MNKTLIGSIVGGFLIFIWQLLSWTMLNTHEKAMQYTSKQDSMLNYLSSQLPADGGYYLPMPVPGTPREECQKQMKERVGKPWAQVSYHSARQDNMVSNMLRNLVVNVLAIWLLCSILAGFTVNTFGKTFLACLFTGLIIFLQGPYVMHIWYESFDIWAHLADYLISWILVGMWLGWYLNRKKAA